MKNSLIFFMLSMIMLAFFPSCERVAPNYQGVLMENFGKNGKDDFSLQKGRVNTMASALNYFKYLCGNKGVNLVI
jgi:hypothetical protein